MELVLRDSVPNDELTKLIDANKAHSVAHLNLMRWAGYIARLDNENESKRTIARPQLEWRDEIKKIAGKNWARIATDRNERIWNRPTLREVFTY